VPVIQQDLQKSFGEPHVKLSGELAIHALFALVKFIQIRGHVIKC